MKTCIKNLFPLPALIAALGLILADRVTAQTFTTLHNFAYSEAYWPYAGVILSGNTLYGTTSSGTVFALSTNGTGFTVLYRFNSSGVLTNSDGASPRGRLILSGKTLRSEERR